MELVIRLVHTSFTDNFHLKIYRLRNETSSSRKKTSVATSTTTSIPLATTNTLLEALEATSEGPLEDPLVEALIIQNGNETQIRGNDVENEVFQDFKYTSND